MNENYPDDFTQPLKKRKYGGIVTEEEKPCDLKINVTDFSSTPKSSKMQESPLDFSIKNDEDSGRFSTELPATDFKAKERMSSFSLVSPCGPESNVVGQCNGRMEKIKITDMHNAFHSGKSVKNPLQILNGTFGNHLSLPTSYPANDNFSENNHSIKTNDSPKASPMSRFDLFRTSQLRDNILERMNFMNNSNAMMSYKDNFNPHTFRHFSPISELSSMYPSPIQMGVLPISMPLNSGYSEGTPDPNDPKSSKSDRPFKKYENEILNYDNPFYPSPSSYNQNFENQSPKTNSPLSTLASSGSSGSPPEQGASASIVSHGSMEVESLSQNGFSDDQQHPNNLQTGQSPDCFQNARRKGQKTPDEKKDALYLEKRRKNNEAAKRSRDARRRKEDEIALKAKSLLEENKYLKFQNEAIRSSKRFLEIEIDNLKQQQCSHILLIERLQGEVERLHRSFSMNGSRIEDRDSEQEKENPGL